MKIHTVAYYRLLLCSNLEIGLEFSSRMLKTFDQQRALVNQTVLRIDETFFFIHRQTSTFVVYERRLLIYPSDSFASSEGKQFGQCKSEIFPASPSFPHYYALVWRSINILQTIKLSIVFLIYSNHSCNFSLTAFSFHMIVTMFSFAHCIHNDNQLIMVILVEYWLIVFILKSSQ